MSENADSKSKACCPYPPAPPVDRITAVEERMTLMENRMTNLEKRMTNLENHYTRDVGDTGEKAPF